MLICFILILFVLFQLFVLFCFCLILSVDFYYCIESVIQCSCLILFDPFLIVFVS
jgi:hypothetical protein